MDGRQPRYADHLPAGTRDASLGSPPVWEAPLPGTGTVWVTEVQAANVRKTAHSAGNTARGPRVTEPGWRPEGRLAECSGSEEEVLTWARSRPALAWWLSSEQVREHVPFTPDEQ